MLQYTLKRILLAVPVVIFISVIVFYIIQLPPGDYVSNYAAEMSVAGEVLTQKTWRRCGRIWDSTVRFMSSILSG